MSERKTWIGRISLYGIMIAATFPKAVGATAAIMARKAGRDIWAAELVAVFAAIILAGLSALAMKRLRTSFLRALEQVLGPWVARPVAILEFMFFCLLYVAGAYTFLAHLMFYMLPETPVIVFLLAIAIISLVGGHYGLEVLARTAILGAIGHLIVTGLMVPGVIWDMNLLNLWPLGGNGWGAFGAATLTGLADLVQPIPLMLAFLPKTGDPSGHVRHSALAMAAAGALILIWPLSEIMVLGPGLTAQQSLACMGLARTASLGVYLHRYELLMILAFMPGVFLVEVLPFLAASRSLAHTLGISDHKRLFLPLIAGLTWGAYFLFSDRLRSDWFFTEVWPWVILPLVGVLLTAAGVVAILTHPRPESD